MPFRTARRRWLLVAASLVMSMAGAAAQSAGPALGEPEPPVWIGRETDEGAALMFAVPHSDDIRFLIECDNKRKRASLTVYDEIKSLKRGQAISIELAAGDRKATLKGTTTTDELYGYIYGRARGIALAPVLAVLLTAGDLSARMPGTVASYPDKERAGAVDTFSSLCRIK